jgi:DNA-binding SARP family transcriptional activator/ABC-type transport system substrate-binding protein
MDFWLLGPLEVREGERILAVGGAKQRALLALLLLHANQAVSRDRLLEELWPERPGAAEHSLDHLVSRLRKTLRDPELLVTRAGGYELHVEPERIDANRFERLLDEGRRSNTAGEPGRAIEALREALALWRGNALADVAYEPFARLEAERLDELRVAAIEERIDAELALGRHEAVNAELEALASRHPLRERLRSQLMLSLYRSGRQAEALRVYADTRKVLVEELGLEPTPALKQLEQAILRQDPSLEASVPEARARRRPRRLALGLALTVAAGAAAGGVLLARGGTQSPHAQPLAQPQSVVLLAARSGQVTAEVPIQAPVLSRFGAGALWNVSFLGILTKIDPATGKALASLNTGVPLPCGLAVGEGAVWVTDCSSPTLVRIDPAQAVVAERIALPKDVDISGTDTGEVAIGAGSIWVAQGYANPSWVERLDPRTGHVRKHILIPEGGAQSLAFGGGALWVGGDVDAPGVPKLSKIDPRTNRIVTTVTSLTNDVCCIAVGGGFVWAATHHDHTVWKIGQDGSVVTGIKLTADAENLSYADGAVWVAAGDGGTVVRIDPTAGATRAYRLGHHLIGVAARSGLVAVGVQPAGQDVTGDLKGRIVRLALKGNYLDWTSTDPAATQYAFNPYQLQFHYATCAKLFNYPDAAGAEGKKLVPEVAAGWPRITDGGRRYTFMVRTGFRFSPPSNEAVTAESFRHELERYLSPKEPGPYHIAEFPDVVGATSYNAGAAAHVSGVSAHGNTLVIRLTKPTGDLPTRLALPGLCAVPRGLPMIVNGLPYPIPSAGPYYLATRSSDVVVLKPNPNYGGSRPRHLDAIVYRMNVDVGKAAALVAQGKVDYLQEDDPALSPGTEAARSAGSRYRLTPNNWTEGLALNARRPLFADLRMRRAVAYALDRSDLAAALGRGIATSHVLAPSSPGYGDGSGYPLSADLKVARRLTTRLHRHAVFAIITDDAGALYDPRTIQGVREQLAAIGIRVTLLTIRQTESADPANLAAVLDGADLARIEGNATTTRDPVENLLSLPYLPAVDRARLERIALLPSPRRERAAALVAAKLEHAGVYVGYADSVTPELVSKRLGCVVEQPEYPGLDLAALCLREPSSS